MPLWGVQSLAATAAAGVRSHKSVSACRRVCVTATCLNALHYSTSHRPPPPFSSQSHSVTFPPFSLFYHLSCFTVWLHRIQMSVHLSVFTTHVHAPSWQGIRRCERSGLHISAGRQDRLWPLCQHTKWNQMPGTPVSENWNHSTVRENKPGLYSPLSHRSRSVSIPNCIQSLLNKNKGLFYSH